MGRGVEINTGTGVHASSTFHDPINLQCTLMVVG